MFDSLSLKNALSRSDALELVDIFLKQAQECRKPAIKFAICNQVDAQLKQMKQLVKRPSLVTSNNISSTSSSGDIGSTKGNIMTDSDQAFREAIARAYLTHANLMMDLQYPELAQVSRNRADKWGGPGTKKGTVTSINYTKPRIEIATVSSSIFPMDVPPPTLAWSFPEPDGRVTDTPQLVSCLALLRQGLDAIPDYELEPEARIWRKETFQNPDEKARLEVLATDLIRAFTRDEIKDKKVISEVVCLVPVLDRDDSRFLLNQFLSDIKDSPILNIGALRGLAQLLRGATLGHLSSQDLIDVLGPMSTKLQDVHSKSPDHIFELTVAVSSVLDAMADAEVTGLKRIELHEPLLVFLGSLRGNDDPHLKFYASYAFQALLCVPNNESPWQATVRRTSKVVKGISGLVSAVKGLNLNEFMTGLQSIHEGFEGVQTLFELGKSEVEGINAVYESEQDFVASLKEGLTLNRRRAWYSALRGADTMLEEGELYKFKNLVCGAICRHEVEFQWGVCQRLGSMAANSLWDIETRQGAVRFLGEIYCNDLVWGQLPPIKAYILGILKQLSFINDDLPEIVLLLKDMATDGNAVKQDMYRNIMAREPCPHSHPLTSGLPEFAHPSLLDRIQRKTDVEVDLRRLARQRIKERGGAIYVTPMAKPSFQSSDEVMSDVMVDQFLNGDQKVLLVLGDSGIGKTTFCQELDLKLWKVYRPRTGRIPLLISLSSIDHPEKDLIAKYLRLCEFSLSQIQELKDREFVIICDGYDDMQQVHNLYETNRLNKNNGWKAQMIISCRSEYIGPDYRDIFQPAQLNVSDPDLLGQAILVPFSIYQISQYIHQYVTIKRPLWMTEEYLYALYQVSNLQELVKNPFLLILTLEVLPRLIDPTLKFAKKIPRIQFYDEFVTQWLERSKIHLSTKDLSDQEKEAFENLSDDGFIQRGLVYLQELSSAIYKNQGGNPVINYSKARDGKTWKDQFFNHKDVENRLLLRAIPMTRSGNRFVFIHQSILEYGVSRAICDPQNWASESSKRRKSVDSAFSFELDPTESEPLAMATITQHGLNPESPLVTKNFIGDHSVMQFLSERIQSESEPFLKHHFLAYIKASKADKKWRIAAANAMTVLVQAGFHFSRLDLRAIQVPGANMSFGVFDSAQLQGADLRKTNLQGAWFRQADLSQAQMSGAQFGQLPTPDDAHMSEMFASTPDDEKLLGVTILPGGGGPYVISRDNQGLKFWGKELGHFSHNLHQENDTIQDIVASPCGRQIATVGVTCGVRLSDVATGWTSLTLEEGPLETSGIVYSDSDQIAFISGDEALAVKVYNIWTGKLEHELTGHEGKIENIAFSPKGGQQLASSSNADSTVRLWDLSTGQCALILKGLREEVTEVAYSYDGSWLFTSFKDFTAEVWDATNGKSLGLVNTGCHCGSSVFSPGGHFFVVYSGGYSKSDEGTIVVWDMIKNKLLWTLGKTVGQTVIALSSDNQYLASSCHDEVIRLWDLETGLQVAQTENFPGVNHSLALDVSTADEGGVDLLLIVGSKDGKTSAWKLMERQDCATTAMSITNNGSHSSNNDNNTTVTGTGGGEERGSESGGGEKKSYELVLQWTTAFGVLNARGAMIKGTRGLSKTNTSLLMQNGACGQPVAPLGPGHVVVKVISSKTVVSRLKSSSKVQRDAAVTESLTESEE